jgi:hypothetical protein
MNEPMSVDNTDRVLDSANQKPNRVWLPLAGLVLLFGLIAAAFLVDWSEEEPKVVKTPAPKPVEVIKPESVPVEPAFDPATVIIEEAPPEPVPEPFAEPVITLADSDEPTKTWVTKANLGALGEQFAAQQQILPRAVGVIDILAQGQVPYKLIPIGRPKTAFGFIDNGLAVTQNPESFSRYDGLAAHVGAIDANALVDAYADMAPLLQEAWEKLGYNEGNLEATLFSALELIIMTPSSDLGARLIKVEANWIYEDPDLEALPPLQKQIMRMGPDNAQVIQDKAREIRALLMER